MFSVVSAVIVEPQARPSSARAAPGVVTRTDATRAHTTASRHAKIQALEFTAESSLRDALSIICRPPRVEKRLGRRSSGPTARRVFPRGARAPQVGLEPTTLRLTAGCSAN